MILTKKNIKSADLDSLIDGKIRSGEISDLLLIYPTNRKVRNLKKEIVSMMPKKSAAGLFVETLGTISSKLLGQSYKFNALSEAAATVFIKQSTARQKLSYFANYKNEIPAGTLDRIKNVISEYKRSGITPEILKREAGSLEKSEKLKALDIAAVYETYNSICHSLKSYETGDIYKFLNELSRADFEKNFFSVYKTAMTIVLVGFDDFTGPEIDIIASLAEMKNIDLYINFEYSRNNDSLFGHLDNTYEKLASKGFIRIDDKSPSERNEFNEIIRDRLFGWQTAAPVAKFKDRIKIISAFDREQEVTAMAKEIKKLIANDGIQPHKICVVFNLIKNYSSAVRDLFSKHGIPFNLSDRQSLSTSPPVTAIVNFLEIAENDYYYKNIFRALNGGFIELPEIDMPNLQKVAAELKIIVGKENWLSSLSAAAEKMDFENAGGEDKTANRQRYLKAIADLKKIGRLLNNFEKKQTLGEFRQTLEEFVFHSGIPLKLIESKNESEADIKAVSVFLETINEIFLLLEEELGKDKKFSLRFFLDQIRTACGWARYNIKEKSDYGVLVTTLEEIRGLKFDYIFIGGMCDGDLPTKYSPEIFFSGSFVKKAAIHQLEERYRFYQVLCSWNKGLRLTWPLTQSGKETVVSTFLKDFEKLFETEKSDESTYANIFSSVEEMQLFFGKQGLEKPEEHSAEDLSGIHFDAGKIRSAVIVDKLRTETPDADSEYSGIILNGEKTGAGKLSQEELIGKFSELKEKQYSVSQLETYAKCPFKFFMERILNVETVEEPTEEIEALELGRVLHEIFFEFYTRMRKLKITVARCSGEVFARVQKILFDIADEVIEKSSFKSPVTFFEREKITGLAGDRRESILYRFLESERNADDNFMPQFFEVSFGRIRKEGSDEILSDSEPAYFGGIKLRGKIDRIEIDAGSGEFNIVDYKLSGAKPGPSDFQNGISLQLPVYLKAAGNLLEKKMQGGFKAANMYIYSLKYKESEFGKKKISPGRGASKDPKMTEDLIESTGAFIKKYVEDISNGRFNLSMLKDREEKVCRFCGFKPICRVDEILS